MEALILLLIAVIAAPILLVIVRHSRDEADKMQKEKAPGIKITVNHPKVPRLICPRCGSPVMLRGNGWECGWCLDSGGLDSLSRTRPRTELRARIVCGVDFPQTWTDLKDELEKLVPQHAAALLPSLRRAAVYEISLSPPPEDGQIEPTRLRDMQAFFDAETEFSVLDGFKTRIERDEILFEDEGVLSDDRFGSFWQSLLDALEEEGASPWETDTDRFFYALACFGSWRKGGPCADPAFPGSKDALQQAFHSRWELLHPEGNDSREYNDLPV